MKVIILFLALILCSQVFVIAYALHDQSSKQAPNLARAITSFSEIEDILKPAINQYHLSKISLSRIHAHSNNDLGSLPSFTVSVSNIQTRPGVLANVEQVTNNPAAMYASVLQTLLTSNSVMVKAEDLPSNGLKELLQIRHTVAVMFVAVRIEDKLVGLLSASWDKLSDVPTGNDLKVMTFNLERKADLLSRYFGLPPGQEKR